MISSSTVCANFVQLFFVKRTDFEKKLEKGKKERVQKKKKTGQDVERKETVESRERERKKGEKIQTAEFTPNFIFRVGFLIASQKSHF